MKHSRTKTIRLSVSVKISYTNKTAERKAIAAAKKMMLESSKSSSFVDQTIVESYRIQPTRAILIKG